MRNYQETWFCAVCLALHGTTKHHPNHLRQIELAKWAWGRYTNYNDYQGLPTIRPETNPDRHARVRANHFRYASDVLFALTQTCFWIDEEQDREDIANGIEPQINVLPSPWNIVDWNIIDCTEVDLRLNALACTYDAAIKASAWGVWGDINRIGVDAGCSWLIY